MAMGSKLLRFFSNLVAKKGFKDSRMQGFKCLLVSSFRGGYVSSWRELLCPCLYSGAGELIVQNRFSVLVDGHMSVR